MPSFVFKQNGPELVQEQYRIELVPRNCTLRQYTKKTIDTVRVDEEIIAYASPDSTYHVTKALIDSASSSILIGIYDFTAEYIRDLVLNAMRNGVKVQIMLDTDHVKGEDELFAKLIQFGADGTPAPSCASNRAHYFRSSHEKVIVIDDLWTLVQSGNFTNNSIPLNEEDGGDPLHFVTGNRDTGLAVKSRKLAKFFRGILEDDIALERRAEQEGEPEAARSEVFLVESAPRKLPKHLFRSKRFKLTKPISVTPVLSPDNYMTIIPGVLKKARKSILIEQQYVHSEDKHIVDLLEAIEVARAKAGRLDVRIILGKIFGSKDIPKEKKNLSNLARKYKLKLGQNIRYIDTSRFVHCHNKMLIIDGQEVLVSSQNWSRAAVAENREAGLLLVHKGIAKYFTDIFESDWSTGLTKLGAFAPEILSSATVGKGGLIEVSRGDYVHV